MLSPGPYVTTTFKMKAEFTTSGGAVEFEDIVSFSASFGLNKIPEATLVVATGREASETGKLATIHEKKDQLNAGDIVKVTLTITNHDGQTDKMESGTMVIFEGKYAGIGYQRSYNHANFTLHLVHWLDNLNQGSMINGNWFPGAPYDMAQNAGYYALDETEGGAGGEHAPVPTIDHKRAFVNSGNIESDMWEKVLKPVFNKIARWPLPRYQDSNRTNEEDNKLVIEALDRMPGAGAAFYSPLGLNLTGLRALNTAEAVRKAITKDALDSFAYSTFWNKLVGEYAPQFYFAISPSAEFALPIPFFAGLSDPWKIIKADEYNYSNFNASMLHVLESVDIFYPAQSDSGYATGAPLPGKPLPTFKLPLGFFPSKDQQKLRGFKLCKEPPTWMTNIFPGNEHAARSAGIAAKPQDCNCPGQGDRKGPDGFLGAPEEVIEQQTNDAMMRFAEHWYKTEVLYQRHGEMSGKLRFDIAPGSIIGIETADYDVNKHDTLFATVINVSYVINAERATAGTSFQLAHIRSSKENTEPTLTSDKPPLYNNAWRGAPLAIATR